MAENLMNSAHKATNKPYRDNYDRIFNREFYVGFGIGNKYPHFDNLSDAIDAVKKKETTIFIYPKDS
jgi:hypothetical protein